MNQNLYEMQEEVRKRKINFQKRLVEAQKQWVGIIKMHIDCYEV